MAVVPGRDGGTTIGAVLVGGAGRLVVRGHAATDESDAGATRSARTTATSQAVGG